MNAEPNPVLVNVEGSVGRITLNRPHKFNCLSPGLHQGLLDAVASFQADARVRAILVDAAGDHFSTGADLDFVQQRRHEGNAELQAFMTVGYRALEALEASPLPVVAAVQGLCLAGGLELMLACDIVIAASSARFGDQHAQFGLVPGWGGTQRLPRIIGQRRALDLMFSARWIEAATALDWGLANYVVDDDKLNAEALAYCTTLATRSAPGLALMKRLARDGVQTTLADGLAMEVDAIVDALRTPDVSEGLAAFEARRKPVFRPDGPTD